MEKKGKHQVQHDSEKSGDFTMKNKMTGGITVFEKSGNGLHCADPQHINMLNTIEENQKHFSIWQCERAKEVRRLHQSMGHPSIKDHKAMVQSNAIKNCPVTVDDINVCEKIFGPDTHGLEGKSV